MMHYKVVQLKTPYSDKLGYKIRKDTAGPAVEKEEG